MEPIYMSVNDAAKRYSIGRTTMYKLMALNEAPGTLLCGGKRLLPIKEFDEFMIKMFSEN